MTEHRGELASREELEEALLTNLRVSSVATGEVVVEIPCWACAAPRWMELPLVAVGFDTQPVYCLACGRSGRITAEGQVVQCGGPSRRRFWGRFAVRVRSRWCIRQVVSAGEVGFERRCACGCGRSLDGRRAGWASLVAVT